MEDLPGQLPKFYLVTDFVWDARFKLFTKSLHTWELRKKFENQSQGTHARTLNTTTDNTGMEASFRNFPPYEDGDFDLPPIPTRMPSLASYLQGMKVKSIESESQRNIERATLHQQKIDDIEKIIAYVFNVIVPQSNFSLTDIPELVLGLNVKERVVKQLLTGNHDDAPKLFSISKGQLVVNKFVELEELSKFPVSKKLYRHFLSN
jgi:hypothetical protein